MYIKAIRFEPASWVSSSGISDAGGGSARFLIWQESLTWDLPRRNRFRVLAVADSSDDRASSPAHDDDDDGAAVAVDATAVASGAAAAAAAAAVAVGTDTGMDIGIGTAATGTGIDIGDWVGVFGVAGLPGPAVPYRWDDMYHQKPGLAVCLHVVFNHFVLSFIRYRSCCGQRGGATLSRFPHVFLLCVWTHRISLRLFLSFSLFEYFIFFRID